MKAGEARDALMIMIGEKSATETRDTPIIMVGEKSATETRDARRIGFSRDEKKPKTSLFSLLSFLSQDF